jgi:hypothetical protein
MTKEFLKKFIISMLGGSQTDVELTDDDLEMAIYHAISYYMSHSSDAFNEEWKVLHLKSGTNLQEVPDDVDYIISINNVNGTSGGTTIIPYTFGKSYEITMLNMITNDNNLQKSQNFIPSKIIYKDGKRYFQVDPIPQQDMNVAAKVLTYKDLSPLYNDQWIQKYSLAIAKMMLGNARSKFSSMNAPVDMSMNGQDLISQAQQEMEKLEQQIFDESVLYNGGIVIG